MPFIRTDRYITTQDAISNHTDRLLDRLKNINLPLHATDMFVDDQVNKLTDLIGERHDHLFKDPTYNNVLSFITALEFVNTLLEDGRFSINGIQIPLSRRGYKDLKGHIVNLQLNLESIISRSDALSADKTPELPEERAAPIRVGVIGGNLKLLRPQTRSGSIDYPSANKIRESLKDTFENLLDHLPKGSNADQRYVRACGRLLGHLSVPLEDISIEALGLNYQLVDRMTKRLKEEIGGSAIDEIEHTLTGVSVLLNQFQEWRDYLQELALTNFDLNDSDGLVEMRLG